MMLGVISGGRSISVLVNHGGAELGNLLDTKVSIRGVRLASPNAPMILLVMDSNDITEVDPSETHAVLIGSLQSLLAEPSWAADGHRIRVRGRVLKLLSDKSLLLTDGTVSVPVESATQLNAPVGKTVEIEGYPAMLRHAVVLQGVLFFASVFFLSVVV